MIEPRVIYACNHYIAESYDESDVLAVSSSGNRTDTLIPNNGFSKDGVITIKSMTCTEAESILGGVPQYNVGCRTFILGEDFDLSYEMVDTGGVFEQKIYIKWNDSVETPPKIYTADIQYVRVINELYEASKCPRCCGDGWYAGIFESGYVNPSKVSKENKLVQCFLKYVYTKKLSDGYGSRMLDVPGKYNIRDKELVNTIIQDELMSFKEYYVDRTSAMILEGHEISDSERLASEAVSDIEIDEENLAIKVTVNFTTYSGEQSSVNLLIANL